MLDAPDLDHLQVAVMGRGRRWYRLVGSKLLGKCDFEGKKCLFRQ